jgi:hypothetical protein
MLVDNNLERDGCGLLNVLIVHSRVVTMEITKTSIKIEHYPTDIRTAFFSNKIRTCWCLSLGFVLTKVSIEELR